MSRIRGIAPDMSAIGGYFEIALPAVQSRMHEDGIFVNSGRHAFEYILRSLLKTDDISRIHLPYYTCHSLLEPLLRLHIPYSFYHINDKLEIDCLPDLDETEYAVVNNYFGIKDDYIYALDASYPRNIIVDNAQAWYAKPSLNAPCFYSPRKFVGLPDGGVAFCKERLACRLEQDFSTDRASHLLRRIDSGAEGGYKEFKVNSEKLKSEPLKRMSRLTGRLLASIDFERIRQRRRENFEYLHSVLSVDNLLEIPSYDTFECPLVYPYWAKNGSLRQRLIDNQVFVATYWPNVKEWCGRNTLEYELATNIIPIPIDQRYDLSDMHTIIQLIKR